MKNPGMHIGVMLVFLNLSVCVQSQTKDAGQKETAVRIRMAIGDQRLMATMSDGSAARDFMTLLPITLTLEDYSGTEKICCLPRKLDTRDEPRGIDPEVGDLAYYAPWGNLAVFYRDFRFSEGLILIGKLDSGSDKFAVAGSLKITYKTAE